jgi:predicted ATPase
MIQSIQIQGYRSLRDVTWNPGKLNLVIGPNASGKSNLLRALALLQDSAAPGKRLSAEIKGEGGMGAILWDGRTERLRWILQTEPIEIRGALIPGLQPPVKPFGYSLDLERLGPTGGFFVASERLDPNGSGGKRYIDHATFQVLERSPDSRAEEESVDMEQTLLAVSVAPSTDPAVAGFRKALSSWTIFHDVRVDRGSKIREAVVSRLEKQLDPDGQNLISVLHTLYSTHREFKSDVDRAMKAAFGEDFEELTFPPAADQRVQLRLRWRSLENAQSAADLSDGTLRFLFLVAALANPEPGRLVAIDEPEVGLHPSMLAVVADLALQASERTQVILSTHSPQLLDAFGGEPVTTTVVQSKDGETKLTVLDGEELARWVKEFSLGALFKSGELEGMG